MSKNEVSLTAIMAQKPGRVKRIKRIGNDFTRIARELRTNRWELTAPAFWALIAAKGSSIFGTF